MSKNSRHCDKRSGLSGCLLKKVRGIILVMGKDSIFYISIDDYLRMRQTLTVHQQSLFDFLYCTGARISEAFKVKARHFNIEKKTVFVPTLKNPNHPLREVRLVPKIPTLLDNIMDALEDSEEGFVWQKPSYKEPRKYAWELSKKHFHCTTHSFRHTHATSLVRDYGANLHELMQEMGWSDPKPAMIYVQYSFGESLDRKINEYAKTHTF